MSDQPRPTGALRTPPEILARAWPIGLALAAEHIPAPLNYHSPKCDVHATIDQNGYGACVCASGAYVQADLEAIAPSHLAWLRMYAILKGLPYPFKPAQDKSPGLNPQQLWAYTKKNGWPTADGSAPHRDADYFSLGKPASTAAFLDVFQQTLLTPSLGPCQFTATWPNNWWVTDANGYMAKPVGSAGGHAFEGCGWVYCPTCACHFDTIHHQTWGAFGHDPELPDHFRVHGDYWDALGWEAWKVADTPNPTPTPEVDMFSVTAPFDGTAPVSSAAGVCFLRVSDGALITPSPAGGTHRLGTAGTFPDPGNGGKPGAVHVIAEPGPLCVVLDRNLIAAPTPMGGGVTHTVVVSVDGVPKATLAV